jgi:protein disulfide-isomerase
MKKIFTLFAILFLALAQTNAAEIKWYSNVKEATDIAIKEKKPLMLFFTGSDWCGWCKRLQAEVLLKPEFAEWSMKNVIACEVDFPRFSKQDPTIAAQNQQLGNLLKVQGYPTVWFVLPTLSGDNKINLATLGSQGYMDGGPNVWISNAIKILSNK